MVFPYFVLGALFLSQTIHAKEVTIGFGISKPPYIIEETQSGLEYEIINEALKAAGHTLKPSFAPQNRGELNLKAKEIDGAATKRKDSFEGFFPSDYYIEYHNFAFSLKSHPLKIHSIADLGKYSIRGFQTAKTIIGPEFKAMAEANPKYSEVANQQLQIAQLFGHRTEVIVGDFMILEYFYEKLKKEQGLEGEMIKYDIFPVSSYTVMFHDKQLRDSFNKGLAKIRANKIYAQLVHKYTGKK